MNIGICKWKDLILHSCSKATALGLSLVNLTFLAMKFRFFHIQSGSPAHRMVLSIFKVPLPNSADLVYKKNQYYSITLFLILFIAMSESSIIIYGILTT